MDPILGTLEAKCNAELLRYAVMRQIYCPHCGVVLDVRTAVHASMRGKSDASAWFGCAPCWGRAPVKVDGGPVEVLDGRRLFREKWHWVARRAAVSRKRKGGA